MFFKRKKKVDSLNILRELKDSENALLNIRKENLKIQQDNIKLRDEVESLKYMINNPAKFKNGFILNDAYVIISHDLVMPNRPLVYNILVGAYMISSSLPNYRKPIWNDLLIKNYEKHSKYYWQYQLFDTKLKVTVIKTESEIEEIISKSKKTTN